MLPAGMAGRSLVSPVASRLSCSSPRPLVLCERIARAATPTLDPATGQPSTGATFIAINPRGARGSQSARGPSSQSARGAREDAVRWYPGLPARWEEGAREPTPPRAGCLRNGLPPFGGLWALRSFLGTEKPRFCLPPHLALGKVSGLPTLVLFLGRWVLN